MNVLTRKSVWALGFLIFASSAGRAEFPAANARATQGPSTPPSGGELGVSSDSGIFGPKYAEIVAEMDSLATNYPQWIDRFQYGTTVEGRPLVALRMMNKRLKLGSEVRQAVIIAGSIHGNEYLNIEDRLPRWFVEQGLSRTEVRKFFDQGGVALFAPILNPDGYEARKRANGNQVDLNRDFTVRRKQHFGFKEPETRALSEFIAEQLRENALRIALTMDYHCCIGAVLRPWGFKTTTPPQADMDRFAAVQTILRSNFGRKYKFGTTPKVLGYSSIGTAKDHYYETYGAVGLTFEGRKGEEARKFPEHTRMWEQILAAINAGRI